MKKPLFIAACVLLALVVVVPVGVWLFVDANQFRPTLEGMMSDALGRKVSIGNIRVALFSGSIAAENLSIADDPAFGTAPFVTAKSVNVGVDLMSLILSRSLRVQSFRLEQPQVTLWRSPSGGWNFSKLGATAAPQSSPRPQSSVPATAMSVVVQKITIANGRIRVGNLAARDKGRVYEDVDVEVTNLSYTSRFPFHVSAKTPGAGTVTMGGEAGPFNVSDMADMPVRATIDVKHVNLASTGFVDPASGLGGLIDFAGSVVSDGKVVSSKGKLKAANVQLMPGSAPARVPLEVDYAADYTPSAQKGRLTQGDVHIGMALARLTGNYDVHPEMTVVRMKLAGEKMPVTALESALPAIGVTLPAGASLRQGTLDTSLAIDGRIDRLVTAGPLTLSNATIAGFDLGAGLGAVAGFAGLPKSGETSIQTLSARVRLAPDGTQVDDLNLVAPAIGTLSGAGTITPKGAMAFKMTAKLSTSNGMAGSVARAASLGQPANGIPFRIEGTTSKPVFVPDLSRSVTSALKNPDTATKAADFLGGLLKKKK